MSPLPSEVTWGSNKLVELSPKPSLRPFLVLRSQCGASSEFLHDFAPCSDRPEKGSRAGTTTLTCTWGRLGLQACLYRVPADLWVSRLGQILFSPHETGHSVIPGNLQIPFLGFILRIHKLYRAATEGPTRKPLLGLSQIQPVTSQFSSYSVSFPSASLN